MQIPNKVFIDTTLPNISERWKDLLLPIYIDKNKSTEITDKIKDTFQQKWRALSHLEEIREKFGGLIT